MLEDREEVAWPLGMLKASWGILSNTWWVFLKTRVSKPFQNLTQPLAKSITIQGRGMHNLWVPLNSKTNIGKTIKNVGEMGCLRKWGKRTKNGNGGDGDDGFGVEVWRCGGMRPMVVGGG